MIHGLHPCYRYAIPILTMQSPFPTLLRCRAFLLLEESRHSEEDPPDIALHVGRAPTPPAGGDHSTIRNNGGGRAGGGCNRGRGHNSGGGQSSNHGGGASRPPAPAAAPWTRMDDAMVPARPRSWHPQPTTGGTVSIRRHGYALRRGSSPAPTPPPIYWQPGAVPAHPLYGAAPGAPPAAASTAPPANAQQPAWDQAFLIQALNNMSLQQGQASGGEWYLDSGATSHMAASPGMISSSRPSSSPDIVVGNGSTMAVTHTGHHTLPTNSHPLSLFVTSLSPHMLSKT